MEQKHEDDTGRVNTDREIRMAIGEILERIAPLSEFARFRIMDAVNAAIGHRPSKM